MNKESKKPVSFGRQFSPIGGLADPGNLSRDPSVRLSLQEYKSTMESVREGRLCNNSAAKLESEDIDCFLIKQMSLRFKAVSGKYLNKKSQFLN